MDIQSAFTLSNFQIFSFCLFAFIFSSGLTWLVRIYSLHKSILDIPNERSSHETPIPRGGGLAIIFTFIPAILGLGILGYIDSHLVWALVGGGCAIAAIGYCDDIFSIKIRWRIGVHFLAAIWAIYWLGSISVLDLIFLKFSFPWLGFIFTTIGIMWCINLYNFMDGIDGLSGSEGIFIALTSSLALWIFGQHELVFVFSLLAAAIGGFTVWNWPPAKIFLGDVGSGFLGYIFAVLALQTVQNDDLSFSYWWIIAGVFVCDATFTLLARMYQKKQWYSAHREHAFQYLLTYGANHKEITLGIFLFNICILLPISFAALFYPAFSILFMWGSTICLWFTWATIRSLGIKEFNRNVEISNTDPSIVQS